MVNHTTLINISAKIFSIEYIEEIEMTYQSEVEIYITWMDPRLLFRNLRSRTSLSKNYVEQKQIDEIWIPPAYFRNTKDNVPIKKYSSGWLEIIRHGESYYSRRKKSENNFFKGSENYLEMRAVHELDFRCLYNLENYPFDIQVCSIQIGTPLDVINFTKIIPGTVQYVGPKQLVQFTVGSVMANASYGGRSWGHC